MNWQTEQIHSLTLHNCDCMEYMRAQPDKSFNLAIVDPPYGLKCFRGGISSTGLLKQHNGCSETFNDNVPTQEYFNELRRVSHHQIIWGANNFGLPPTEYFCIWDKMQSVDNFASAEYAWCSPSLKMPAKVFRYSIMQHNADTKKIHPTQKPVKLYQWLLQTYARGSDRVLDTHLGSGSHAIAAHYGGFEFVGCELDQDYFRMSVERIKRETSQIDMFSEAARA